MGIRRTVLTRLYQLGLNRFSFFRRWRFEQTYRSGGGFGPRARHEKIARDLIAHIPTRNKQTALDLGCGYGFVASKLARKIPSVTAVDISPTALAVGRTTSHKVRFVQHDVTSFRTGHYDLIVCIGILPYLPARSAQTMSANIDSMLNPGGTLFVAEKKSYTGTRIDRVIGGLPYIHHRAAVRIAGEPFILAESTKPVKTRIS